MNDLVLVLMVAAAAEAKEIRSYFFTILFDDSLNLLLLDTNATV